MVEEAESKWLDRRPLRLRIHDIHPYFAKFDPSVPRHFIEKYTTRGEAVVDPFCGSGTTLVEASVVGRHSTGVDANPLAVLISKVKTQVLTSGDRDYCRRLASSVVNHPADLERAQVPQIPNVDRWFKPHVRDELSRVLEACQQSPAGPRRDFLLVAFSRIIIRASNQSGESRYVAVKKEHPPGLCFRLFRDQVLEMLEAEAQYAKARKDVTVTVVESDTRVVKLPTCSFSLAVTSPPYLNAWDYSLYHRFRLMWLGLELSGFWKREIGMHLRGQRNGGDIVEEYRSDMRRCIENVAKSLRPGARFVILNAPAVVNKHHIDTNELLIKEAYGSGFELEDFAEKPLWGPHFGMRASLVTKAIGVDAGAQTKNEAVITLKRVS